MGGSGRVRRTALRTPQGRARDAEREAVSSSTVLGEGHSLRSRPGASGRLPARKRGGPSRGPERTPITALESTVKGGSLEGRNISHFRVLGKLGGGGMGSSTRPRIRASAGTSPQVPARSVCHWFAPPSIGRCLQGKRPSRATALLPTPPARADLRRSGPLALSCSEARLDLPGPCHTPPRSHSQSGGRRFDPGAVHQLTGMASRWHVLEARSRALVRTEQGSRASRSQDISPSQAGHRVRSHSR